MKILKYKIQEILKILSFIFIFFYFLSSYSFVDARINPYPNPSSCSRDSQCTSLHGDGTCCMADIYSNDSLYNYFLCISNPKTASSCSMYTGSVSNKCWPKDVCLNGLDYAISGVLPVDGKCGPAIGLASFTSGEKETLRQTNQYCSAGTIASTEPKLNTSTKTWTWTCLGQNNGANVNCTAKYADSVNNQINGVCYSYSVPLSSEPTQLCVSGISGVVVLNDGVFSWTCAGRNGGASVICNADAKSIKIVAAPETNPFAPLVDDPITKPVSKGNTTQTEIVSSYPTIEQKPANILSYNLLEKYTLPCSIKFDSECEVLDQKFLDVIKSKTSIKDAVDSGKLNGDMKVAKMSWVCSKDSTSCQTDQECSSRNAGVCIGKEVDNYKTGLTLTNIQKLRKARVLPVGMELAALCITGQIPCSNGYIYDGGSGSDGCPSGITNCHKSRNVLGEVTLNRIITGYSICDPLAPNYSEKNDPFCHLVNPNWILKDPKYMCESGTKNGQLLYVTDKQSQSNIRYETCPDVSTCLSEKNNEDCNAYGYCLREKNIWRFDLSADSCLNQNVGCSKYTYTMGGAKTTLGFVSDTTDKSVCDQSNAGCRKYSLVKTGSSTSDWSYDNSDKIYLNNKITACDASQEGCTAFIRRDSANLIKNSSFEEYSLSSDFSKKEASFWIDNNTDEINDSINLQTASDSIPVFNGSNSLVIKRTSSSNATTYVGYNLNKDYFIDVEPNKTYTLSYYILGYNLSFTSDDVSKYSKGAYVNVKEYDKNKTLIPKKVCTSGDLFNVGSICNSNSDCGSTGVCGSSSANNIIDVEAFRYVNNFISSTWTRKTVSFKTGLDTYYLDILPIISRINSSSTNPVTAVFDALQLQEGGDATTYTLYEKSTMNYLKKAPDYANCYTTSSDKDKIFCSNFIKSCDKKDVGCRKYEKKDNSEYWLPGKPNEDNYCTSECKGYQLYKESGPSYDPLIGSSFQSLIASTASSCSSNDAGCSEYKNLSNGNTEYFSSIRACVKENDDFGTCNNDAFIGSLCSTDSDCGSVAGACVKSKAQYADYFTYTGSETSGYKLNVYRLLRTKACSNNTSKYCSVDSDCGTGSVTCGYYSDVYAPATIVSNSLDKCNAEEYKKQNHNPNCREFHGPKDATAASGGSDGDYVLYYANMSDIIPVSDKDCSYYSIVPYQNTINQIKCSTISHLAPSIRYIGSTSTCNVGIYIPESTTCSSTALNCREYNGTSISSETLFTDNFESGDDSWKKGSGEGVVISTESIFVNEHSLKVAYPESITKVVAPDIINPAEKSLYKVRLYAKNDSSDGTLSSIRLRVGTTFSSAKQISNDWRFIGFDIFSSGDLTSTLNYIEIINDGLISGNKSVNLFVDYISIEKSSSVYVIKDTWKTPVSCDNSIDNPTGACNTQYQALGFCTMEPNKVCLTGDNVGAVCTTANDCSSDGSNKGDTCDYPSKVCRWGDNKNAICSSDDDCYNSPNDPNNLSAKVGSCFYTTTGYRLELGKMIGCDEYIDSYGNDEFYVFNDLNLCSADKMGCEALYDTKNSTNYQRQEFNKNVDYTNVVAYYTFDDKNYIAKNDFSSSIITNTNNAVYVKDGISTGAVLLSGSNYISEPISDSLKKVTSNISIYSWVRPNSFAGSIVSFGNYYNLSILNDGQVRCSFNNNSISLSSGVEHKLVTSKWQNVLCSYDGDRIKIYINGEFVASSNDVVINFDYGTDTTSSLRVGSGVVGSLDDVRIYNKFFDSKQAYDSYKDYSDNYYVDADELSYYIIDSKYSCDAKYKGCRAVGRNEDRYDSKDFSYSTAYFVVDPDKFKSSGNYATTGVYDATMCKAEEEGCYSFQDANNANINFKFPKNLCVYRANVDVGVSDSDTGNAKLQTGWFKYDVKKKSVSNEGCYLDDTISNYSRNNITGDPKIDSNSYKMVKSSDCEYRKDPVVIRRSFYGVCKTNPSLSCSVDSDCPSFTTGTCDNSKYITRPKQTTYYLYKGSCSEDSSRSCSEDSMCTSGYCILERTNSKCNLNSGDPYCKPYGYDENPGVIDQFSNKSFEFNVCQNGSKVGSYCDRDSDCPGSTCGAPWTVIGWFKKNSTKGCSDDGLQCTAGDASKIGTTCLSDSDCGTSGKCSTVIEYTDYLRDYNESVGICNEYGCTNFIEPTERRCTAGSLNGYSCASNNDCGENGICLTDELNGSKYCSAKSCTNDNQCGGGAKCLNNKCSSVDKINQSCNFDKDCGFAGVCTGNNIYSYINNSKINSSGCNGKVSRESGCVLFNDTSNSQLKFSSKLTYSGVKNGIAVSAVTGDNSGGDSQKDSNVIIKVKRDRECAEWMTFDEKGSPTKQTYDVKNDEMYPNCVKLSQDGRCLDGVANQGNGWSGTLDVKYYLSQMKGDWFDQDFSGFAIPNRASINKDVWWKSSSYGSSSILSPYKSDLSVVGNVVCKAYPERDSPFNFEDKYIVTVSDCSCLETVEVGQKCSAGTGSKCMVDNSNGDMFKVLIGNNGKISAMSYNQYKNLSPRDYFKSVSSGISIPYSITGATTGNDSKALYRVDNSQDCYYQKVNYKDVLSPREQYFGKGQAGTLPASVCYSTSIPNFVDPSTNNCTMGVASSIESKVADYTSTSLKYKGYCAEYDYSHEIYYIGSGKYNCLTWIPGFINEK